MGIYRAKTSSSAEILAGNQDIPNLQNLMEILKIEILQIENPVGKVRIETFDTNPAEYLGFGTWEPFARGKTIIGIDASQTEFNIVEKTGGEKTHTLTTDEMPSHGHRLSKNVMRDMSTHGGWGTGISNVSSDTYLAAPGGAAGDLVLPSGGDPTKAHNNLPPYITVYMWKRVA